MTNDLKTTLLAFIAGICTLLATVFPGALGEMLKIVVGSIGAVAIALWGYFTNKGTTPPAG